MGTRRNLWAPLAALAAGLFLASLSAFPAGAQTTSRVLRDKIDLLKTQMTGLDRELQAANDSGLDAPLDRAAASLKLGKTYLDHADLLRSVRAETERVAFWTEMAEFTLREGALALTPSRAIEARGMLLDADSIPKTIAEVRTLVAQLASANFNMILPEVMRRGYAIYPSRWLDRDVEFKGAPDVFAELVKEAHRRGLEVHPWIWTFRVRSYDEKRDFGDPVLSKLPGLAARSEETQKPRFLSPAAPGSREFILRVVGDMIDRYDVDGLFLDYIRYDEETPDDWVSQTNYRLERFGSADPWAPIDRRDYQLWREEKVNRVVAEVAALMRTKSRNLSLSAATFRSESYSRKQKLQNWRHWDDNAWLTFTTSMLYSDDAKDLESWITSETNGGKRPSLFYPILGMHRMDDPSGDLLEQIRVVRQLAEPGILIFALGHFPRSLLADLARGPFRSPAVPPHRNPIGAAKQVLQDLNGKFLPKQAASSDWATVAAARVLQSELGGVVKSMPAAGPYYQSGALVDRLGTLQEIASRLERVNPGFQSEVSVRLKYASSLIRAYEHRATTTRYIPPTQPPADSASGAAPVERP